MKNVIWSWRDAAFGAVISSVAAVVIATVTWRMACTCCSEPSRLRFSVYRHGARTDGE
jgi:hypothetical protein